MSGRGGAYDYVTRQQQKMCGHTTRSPEGRKGMQSRQLVTKLGVALVICVDHRRYLARRRSDTMETDGVQWVGVPE